MLADSSPTQLQRPPVMCLDGERLGNDTADRVTEQVEECLSTADILRSGYWDRGDWGQGLHEAPGGVPMFKAIETILDEVGARRGARDGRKE